MLDAASFNPPCESVHTSRPQDSGRTPHPMTKIRLIIDPPATGPWNMAIDEVLAHSAAERGVNTLRFYSWDPPTLSLGYFQRATDRQTHISSSTCAWVRRTSGGGAILHDRELTYSFATATPVGDRGQKNIRNTCVILLTAFARWSGLNRSVQLPAPGAISFPLSTSTMLTSVCRLGLCR